MRTKDQEIIELAKKRFKRGAEAEDDFRTNAVEDLRFHNGTDQWDHNARTFREEDDRICLTVNRIPAFTRQVTNDIRQMRPRIKVSPIDGGGDKPTSLIFNGIIRAIESRSNAEQAYDWAATRAVKIGRGAFRIGIRYVGGFSFKREIYVKRIRNDLSVVADPDHTELSGSDMNWCFVFEEMDKEEFEEAYPGKATADISENMTGMDRDGWFQDDKVRIAEYWTREEMPEKLSLLPDGTIVEGEQEGAIMMRDVKRSRVVFRKITGSDVLEETVFPSSFIPIVLVYGDEEDIEGELRIKGMVRDLKDSQRSYNFGKSVEAERAALMPKAPWVGPEGTFESPKWLDANKRNYPFLEYVNKGTPPTRTPPPDASSGIAVMMDRSSSEMRDITGIHEASMGQQGNETAGIAIHERRTGSDTSNFHYVDNLSKSIQHAGRVMLDLVRDVYKGPQVITILELDGSEKEVTINAPGVDEKTQKPYLHDLSKGQYDTTVDTGPGYATLREESAKGMLDLIKMNPQYGIIGDLAVKAMNWPDSEAAAERIKLTLPPAVLKGENPAVAQMMEQMQQQMQQVQQQAQAQIGQLTTNVQALLAQLQDKTRELQVKQYEAETKRIEVERKRQEDIAEHAIDSTRLEIDAVTKAPDVVI